MRARLDANEPSLSWTLKERYRALLWNADRIAQLLLLLTTHGEVRAAVLRLPSTWAAQPEACAAVVAANALAEAMLRYVYPVAVGLTVMMPLGADAEGRGGGGGTACVWDNAN